MNDVYNVQLALTQIYHTKNKTMECKRVESNLLKDSSSVVASTAEENGISEEERSKKMV